MKKYWICIIPLLAQSLAHAYKFDSHLQSPRYSNPAHEKLTELAYDCVLSYKGSEPKDCITNLSHPIGRGIDSDTYFKVKPFDKSIQLPFTKNELMKASSWPDDPVRELRYQSALKSAAKLAFKCANKRESVESGFFCNSHFGQLQFWHSMASYRAKDQPAESYHETRRKVLSWIWFSYSIAIGEIPLEENYCPFFSELRDTPVRKEFSEAFYSKSKNKYSFRCPKGVDGDTHMSVASIYNNLCSNPFRSKTCTVVHDSREIYLAALGAAIHAVQDSYSQSHTNRNSCQALNSKTGKPKAVSMISCQAITNFYDYASQSTRRHGVSDLLPVLVGGSCGTVNTHDAITATAKIIWFAQKGGSAKVVEEYVSEHVFTQPPQTDVVTAADAGVCYAK